MHGCMIYERGNVARNARYIELFACSAKKRDVLLEVLNTDEISYGFMNGAPFLHFKGEPYHVDFVLMRCMRPLLSAHLESMGIPVFNNARISALCNDKRATARHFAARSLPFVATAFADDACRAQPFSYPVVVKAACGCGGRQVYLCTNDAEYGRAFDQIRPDAAVVQPLLNAGGRDVRLYMLGGKLRAAMERYSDGADFRSNFGLNGKARPYLPDVALETLALRAIDGLDAGLVGVDFLLDEKGGVYLNEIEDAVGTRMLYQYTKIDIVDEYLEWIMEKIQKNQ